MLLPYSYDENVPLPYSYVRDRLLRLICSTVLCDVCLWLVRETPWHYEQFVSLKKQNRACAVTGCTE